MALCRPAANSRIQVMPDANYVERKLGIATNPRTTQRTNDS